MKKRLIFFTAALCSHVAAFSQDWLQTGTLNTATAANNTFGTRNNFPIRVFTNSLHKATFTTNFSLGPLSLIPGVQNGDGLSIMARTSQECESPSQTNSTLDLWTACSNETHIRFATSGQISGFNSRMEYWATNNGFYFNADNTGGAPRFLFNTNEVENARVGTNLFWRLGLNPSNVDAVRRLDVVDDGIQFRLGRNANAAVTDFTTTATGHLNIEPFLGSSQNVGINVASPSEKIDVNGNARLRVVPNSTFQYIMTGVQESGVDDIHFSKLALTGNPSDVLLGDGTWGAGVPAAITADNGVTINPSSNVQWGQINTGTGTLNGGELIHDTEIPFNNYNVFFPDATTPSLSQNRIQFGDFNYTSSPISDIPIFAELTSIRDEDHTALRVGAYHATSNVFDWTATPIQYNAMYFGNISTALLRIGVVGIASETTGGGIRFVGVSGAAFNATSNINIGTSGKAYGNITNNTGVNGTAGSNDCASFNYGTVGTVNSPGNNFGVYGFATNGTTNYGVYGSVVAASTCGGTTNYAGYFDGDVYISGTYGPSDRALKTNINKVSGARAIISKLDPQTYEFKQSEYPSMNLPKGQQYGLMAQDVEQILPELVKNNIHPSVRDSSGKELIPEVHFKGINYTGLIPLLVAGQNEMQQEIDQKDSIIQSLAERLNQLENCINKLNLCSNKTEEDQPGLISTENIELSDAKSIILDQNVPNPFAEQTTITYKLTEDVKRAQILFYNSDGKLINSMELTERGTGKVNVFANDLSNGIYTYILVVDGKIMDSKRMVKNK